MDHPISSVVTRPKEKSQRAFAVAALRCVEARARVSAEVSDEGLLVRALTELDVEIAFHEVKQHFIDAICSKPRVAYRIGPPLMEPYYRAIVDTPEDCLSSVMGDMSNRRASIRLIADSPIGKQFVASVPVSECIGYETALQSLTRGRGTFVLEFSHYARVLGDDAA
jgi:translation elongation factor EF-G